MTAAVVLGVGMAPFSTPRAGATYVDLGQAAARVALDDAGVSYDDIGQVYAGYVFGDSACGQRVVYGLGRTGAPVFNVNNYCATGSSALFLARQAVEGGGADCVLALGFEQMAPGALASAFPDRASPIEPFAEVMAARQGWAEGVPRAAQFFGGAAREHQARYGTKAETFAKVSVKARRHAANNPLAVFRDPITLEEVMGSPTVFDPLTRLQCCPPTSGAAAAVICSEAFAARHGASGAVRIRAQAMTTDQADSFDPPDMMRLVGYGMARRAADQVFAAAGVGPDDIDVVELHDCFSANELISYEALGFAPEGGGERVVEDGDNTYGGALVVNPSGGLLSKGHPLGATGLAQCAELTWQLRGQAGARQVEGARLALQHNLGLGGACVVTLYEKA